MTEEVFGIPSQTFMDMLTLVTNDGPSEYAKVIHCKNITFTAEFDKACQPVDTGKYPNWECIQVDINKGHLVADGHHDCIKHNEPILPSNYVGYYCCCDHTPQNIYNYALMNKNARALCEGCITKHSKTEPCPFCGEVHD